MFSDSAATRRFWRAFVVSWLIQFSFGFVAIGFSSVVLVNFIHVIGGGQYAPSEVSMDAFLQTIAHQRPRCSSPAMSSLPCLSPVTITIDKQVLTARVGRAPPETLREVDTGMRLVLAL